MIEDVVEMAQRAMRGEVASLPLLAHPHRSQRSKLGGTMSLVQGRYIVFGGNFGSGKTAVIDSEFLLKPFEYYLLRGGTKPFWVYRAMERRMTEKKAKFLGWKMFLDGHELMDVPTILGLPNKTRDLTPKDIELFKSYDGWFCDLMKHVDLIPGSASPQDIIAHALGIVYQRGHYCETEGRIVKVNGQGQGMMQDYEVKDGVKRYYKDFQFGRVRAGEKVYFPHEEMINVHITDHLQKLVGPSEQANINDHAHNMADILRDVCGWTVIDVMQFNREQHDTYRQIKTRLRVTEKDFRMSSVPLQNADHIFGLLDPVAMDKTKHNGYQLGLGPNDKFRTAKDFSRFRNLDIVKNSFGPANVSIGYVFYGEVGYVEELPHPDDMTDETYELIKLNKFLHD